MYFNGPVSYPFGYGLSYTTFAFSQPASSTSTTPTADDTITRERRRQRTRARRDGNEIVEMYVDHAERRPVAGSGRSSGWRASRRSSLAAGQTKTVTLPIKIADLAFYNDADKRFEVDARARTASRSRTSSADADIQLQDTINVSGALTPKPSVAHRPAADRRRRRRARHLAAGDVPRGRRRSTRA